MIAYIINGKSFGSCVDYVTRRTLEERLYDEQSRQQKAAERKYEPAKRLAGEHEAHVGAAGARWQSHHDSPQPNSGEDIVEHLSAETGYNPAFARRIHGSADSCTRSRPLSKRGCHLRLHL